ncbi:hypothetical protein [Fluviicola chungangensis]|uniref:hypothetical protein n=1 Tax=Fluviicola chungangensis TaxID=2597671 RepID=UPI003CCC5960
MRQKALVSLTMLAQEVNFNLEEGPKGFNAVNGFPLFCASFLTRREVCADIIFNAGNDRR